MRAPLPPVPTPEAGPLVLRPWGHDDADAVIEAGADPFIPLITTVPARTRPTPGRSSSASGDAPRRLDRIELSIEPWNTGSRRVPERTGFRCEGLLRAYEYVGGERRDMLLYARLAGDPDLGVTTA